MKTENAMKSENLQSITEKLAETAEEMKNQSEAMIQEGQRLLQRTGREIKAEFDRHPVAVIAVGAAVAGALIWLLTRK